MLAQEINEAYALVGEPRARQAYERHRRLRPSAATGGRSERGRGAPIRPDPAPGPVRSLAAELGPELLRRFAPLAADGPGWLFDFAGVLQGSDRHRIWMKRFLRRDTADARAFLTMIEATRLARPLWWWGSDLFVAVLPGLTTCFEGLLRGPRGPIPSLGSAVAALDLTTRVVHTAGRGPRLPTVRALTAALALPH